MCVCVYVCVCVCVCVMCTHTHQDPLSMGFPRQDYWSGMPFPSPGDPPDPGIKPVSITLQADSLSSELPNYGINGTGTIMHMEKSKLNSCITLLIQYPCLFKINT